MSALQMPRYSIDTSCIIHAWRRAYPPEHFTSFWEKLEGLITNGIVVASVEVLNELRKKDDDIYQWAQAQPSHLFMEIDDVQQPHLSHVMGRHPRLVDTTKGRSECDPFVIALALSFQEPLMVISEENNGKANSPKIPDVCRAENLTCIKLVDLIRLEKWVF
ncbi:DUF4411 family protein [Methylotenera sp. 1P/1]|uniref:DUF4411 family protein n=1 Tax=Methylotenera sp. 1P/1 TaxID=1131551 RepID=UPI00037585FD|nr:DUF4411 family protein [Methylotenera sp. 1P/1]